MRWSIPIVAACLSACTSTPDDLPSDALLAAECEACLEAEDAAGCGAEEAACTEDDDCEESMLCALRFDCFAEDRDARCIADMGCDPEAASGADLFEAFESCARSVCAADCDFVGP